MDVSRGDEKTLEIWVHNYKKNKKVRAPSTKVFLNMYLSIFLQNLHIFSYLWSYMGIEYPVNTLLDNIEPRNERFMMRLKNPENMGS